MIRTEETYMVNFAFCCEQENELNFMKAQIEQCFLQKGITIAIRCYQSAYELERCLHCNCPDILIYNIEEQNGQIRAAAIAAKRLNKKLISIVTKSRHYSPSIEDSLLEPLYIMPEKNKRHLWAYAYRAYETFLDDENSFSYYVRPEYIHIAVKDILYFASEGRRTHVIYSDSHDTFYQKLDEIEKHIRHKNGQFLRIHKSYLVNASYISGYTRDYVALTTGEKLRISRYEYYRILNDQFRQKGQKPLPRYN